MKAEMTSRVEVVDAAVVATEILTVIAGMESVRTRVVSPDSRASLVGKLLLIKRLEYTSALVLSRAYPVKL
jgi:hypothetical protein